MVRVLLLLVTLLLASSSIAQEEGETGGSKAGSNPVTGRAVPRSLVPVAVQVRGVSPEDSRKVLERVLELEEPVYVCPRCAGRTRAAGDCDRCEGVVEKVESTTVHARARFSTDRDKLVVTVHPHHWASLERLGRLLAEIDATIDRAAFRLPEHSRVLVTGATEDEGRRIRGALVDLEVFEKVVVTADPGGRGVWIVPLEGSEATVGRIEEVLAKLDPDHAVADVQWAAYCPHCGRVSTMRMGEPICTESK